MSARHFALVTLLLLLVAVLVAQAQSSKPITYQGLTEALRIGGLSLEELTSLVKQRGVNFELTRERVDELRKLGADDDLLVVIRQSRRGSVGGSSGSGGYSSTEWKTYTYESDAFAIAAPQAPTFSQSNTSTAAGTIQMHNYIVELGNSAALLVSVAEYGSSMRNADPRKVLQGGRDGALQSTNGHVISERSVSLEGYPGLAMEAENATTHFSVHFYLVRTRLFQTLVVTPIGTPFPDTDRFHNSLHLLSK